MTCSTNTSSNCPVYTELEPVYRGDSKNISLSFVDSNGDAIDLTGDTLTLTVKSSKSDETALYEEVQTDVDFTNAVGGLALFTIPKTTTDNFTANRAVYFDVYWELADGQAITFVSGTFKVLEPVHTVEVV